MNSELLNDSGCLDPTPYMAMKKIKKYYPIIFVSSPYRGEIDKNIKKAKKYSRFVVEKGGIPFTPHLLFPQIMDDDSLRERDLAMHFNYVLLGKCQEIWIFGENITEGMAKEIKIAKKRKMKIRYFTEDLKEVV